VLVDNEPHEVLLADEEASVRRVPIVRSCFWKRQADARRSIQQLWFHRHIIDEAAARRAPATARVAACAQVRCPGGRTSPAGVPPCRAPASVLATCDRMHAHLARDGEGVAHGRRSLADVRVGSPLGRDLLSRGAPVPNRVRGHGDVKASFAKVRELFRAGKWTSAIRRVRETYGVEDSVHDALMESGEDAWVYWGRDGVGPRGEIVHGRGEVEDDATVEWAIAFVDRLREWVHTPRNHVQSRPARWHASRDLGARH
jgi:hypothetical protein